MQHSAHWIAGDPGAAPGVTMHLITDFTAHAGAETMLARCLRHGSAGGASVVSLRGVSQRNRELAGDRATFDGLGASGLVTLAGAAAALAVRLRRSRPARLVCWMYHAMVVGTCAAALGGYRGPIFWMVRQSLDDPTSLSRSSRLAVAGAARLSRFADGIVYNSDRARRLHRDAGYASRNDLVIPNGFELPRAATARPHAPRVFGIAARVHPQKDYPTFLAAAARLAAERPEARFVAVGAGAEPDDAGFRKLVADAGIPPGRLDARGQVSDMAEFYREIDVLVLSSRTEGFPNVVGEAMSHARPVVTTDVGDAAAIVGRTGLVVPPGDPDALAAAMKQAMAWAPADYARQAHAARTTIARDYEIGAIVRRIEAFIAEDKQVATSRP